MLIVSGGEGYIDFRIGKTLIQNELLNIMRLFPFLFIHFDDKVAFPVTVIFSFFVLFCFNFELYF